MGLLDGDIRRAIGSAFRGKLLKGYIRRRAAATTVDENNDPIVTGPPIDFQVEGFDESYSQSRRERGNIPADHVQILLIVALCRTVPVLDDRLYLRRKWWRLVDIATDPAQATYTCQAAPASEP